MLVLLLEAAFRSLALGCAVWLSLRLLSLHYPQARMTAWTVVLVASVLMPLLMHRVIVTIPSYSPTPTREAIAFPSPVVARPTPTVPFVVPTEKAGWPSIGNDQSPAGRSQRSDEQTLAAIDWQALAIGLYFVVAGGL